MSKEKKKVIVYAAWALLLVMNAGFIEPTVSGNSGGGFSDEDYSADEQYRNEVSGSGNWSDDGGDTVHSPVIAQRFHYQQVESSSYSSPKPWPFPSSSFSPPLSTSSCTGLPSSSTSYGHDSPFPCGILAPIAAAVIAFVSWRALFGKKKQPSHPHQYHPRQRLPRKHER